MGLKKFFPHTASGSFVRVFAFNTYSKDILSVLSDSVLESLGVDPMKSGNLKDSFCGATFDLFDVDLDIAFSISRLFPERFVLTCKYWNGFDYIGTINGEKTDNIYMCTLNETPVSESMFDITATFVYNKIAVMDVQTLVSKAQLDDLTRVEHLNHDRMFLPKEYAKAMKKEEKRLKKEARRQARGGAAS